METPIRKALSFVLVAVVAAALSACSSSSSSSVAADGGGISDAGSTEGGAPVVTVTGGQVSGHTDGRTFAFLGIPYAKPPTKSLRWKPPQAPEPWTGVLDASHFGNRCAQNANSTLQTAASTDEDCLYLNVWMPSPATGAAGTKLPVMVWFHGGGNTGGSASDPVPFADGGYFYSGASLASDGVIVVTLNYRLGVLGFFPYPGLATEGSKAANQGLWDQRFALQWVQDNIAKFGGDPGNVTIFGESAGSFDVCMHVASPQTPALFEHAVSESGGCTTYQPALADSQALMLAFASGVGCAGDGGADSLACLRALPVSTLLAGAVPDAGMTGSLGPFAPVVDDDFLSDQPRTLYKSGKIAKVPYLLGSNNDEGTLFELGVTPVTDQAGLTAALNAQYGDAGAAVAAQYPVSEFDDGGVPNPYQAALTRVVGDSLLVCSTYDSALLASAQGAGVYMYNFDIPVEIPGLVGTMPGELYLGASHGSELPFVFGTSPQFATDAAQATISQIVERYWTRFAAAGDPNGGTDLVWPKFGSQNDQRVQFALPAPSILTGFRESECNFWIGMYEAQFP
jgi:para-nitrobenzyl esterase